MKHKFSRRQASTWLATFVIFFGAVSFSRAEQKKSKQKKSEDAQSQTVQMPSAPDQQIIDTEISEMLGAWQIGDVERLHKYIADNVVVVSGAFEEPVVGWTNYLAAFQRQRQGIGPQRLDRKNTYIFVHGDVAWANYQWNYVGEVNGRDASAQGHTSLIFVKTADRWMIVHNHTSEVCPGAPAQPAAAKPGM
ncbi:MAG: nuclear transport factor 2 family protein [Candidatus Acidiferrales bacterium]